MSNVDINAEELESDIQNKISLLILDLRNASNFMEGHIEGSANAKFSNEQQK